MLRRFLLVFLTVVLTASMMFAVTACGKHSVDLTETQSSDQQVGQTSDPSVTMDYSGQDLVEIVFTMYTLSGETIEEYVANLEAENPYNIYRVYDDQHYVVVLPMEEVVLARDNINNPAVVDSMLQNVLNNDTYQGAFLNVEYDDEFRNVTFYVDRTPFDNNQFMCVLGSSMTVAMISDMKQAYNNVPIEDRSYNINYIDDTTGEIIEVN